MPVLMAIKILSNPGYTPLYMTESNTESLCCLYRRLWDTVCGAVVVARMCDALSTHV